MSPLWTTSGRGTSQFRLIDLHLDTLSGLLERAKSSIHYTVPFPVAV